MQRLLAKRPEDRPTSASAVAEDLKACLVLGNVEAVPRARTMTWLIVLPFRYCARMPRPTSSPSVFPTRSQFARGSPLAGRAIDRRRGAIRRRRDRLRAIASEAHVDLVMTGTLLRAGEAIRVTTQLVGAPGGEVLWSHAAHATLRDVFQLQDDLVRRIVSTLSLPLTAGEQQLLKRDVPASPTVYEFHLRANQMLQQPCWLRSSPLRRARPVLEERRGGSALRAGSAESRPLLPCAGKSGGDGADENMRRAELCLQRALALAVAARVGDASLCAARVGPRTLEGWVGAAARRRAGPRPRPGVVGVCPSVHACRDRGLLSASAAAHERGDGSIPEIATSGYTA